MSAIYDTDYVRKEILSGPITIRYTLGEMKELWDELCKGDWIEARKELDDVGGCITLYVAQLTGWNLPIIRGFGHGAIVRWIDRRKSWCAVFSHHGMVFHKRYLFCAKTGTGGGNFRKRHKVEAALQRAGYTGPVDYDGLLPIVGYWEG